LTGGYTFCIILIIKGGFDMSYYDDSDNFSYLGDPRRCPKHPNEVTSSPDGLFDAPCGRCEYEMDAEFYAEMDAAEAAPKAEFEPPVDEDGDIIPF
jgi:hypothetical protein